jgi:hypothetical protein
MTLYNKQKQIPETCLMFFQIKEVRLYNDIYFLKGNDGETYSYKIREKDLNWHRHFKVGNWLSVFLRKVHTKDKTYRNIYPDINHTEPINPDDIDMDELEGQQAMKDEEMQKGLELNKDKQENI